MIWDLKLVIWSLNLVIWDLKMGFEAYIGFMWWYRGIILRSRGITLGFRIFNLGPGDFQLCFEVMGHHFGMKRPTRLKLGSQVGKGSALMTLRYSLAACCVIF